ncbi:hypothetical protein HUA78_33220 [Myxococcus sp. CA033]|uniref:hypothetical protein n=1 Tax=Myxococcus sp. CA033 TaxID=2741516 RepID=UPI00157A723E|nr:hypothetical protein [Myxococcus sp. CA033]NTX39307.1 hypothetical protein [Myxococcus sp. CA033]
MPTGLAADGTYGAGARHTFDMTAEEAWRNWAEAKGLGRWLSPARASFKEGDLTTLKDGTDVVVIRARPPTLLRIRLNRIDWPRPRTAQLRVLPAARGHTVALHAEGLPDATTRADYIQRWTKALTGEASATTTKVAANSASAKKTSTRKTAVTKSAAKKTSTRKTVAKKSAAKKPSARKPAAKKPSTRKPAAKKSSTRKTPARR